MNRRHPLWLPLWSNAILLALVMLAALARHGGGASLALAQQDVTAVELSDLAGFDDAGPAGPLYLMPGQVATNLWGVWLLDVDGQTLVVYEYVKGERSLRLIAARDVRWDRQLDDFRNASPTPAEVRELVEAQRQAKAGGDAQNPPAATPEPPATTGQVP